MSLSKTTAVQVICVVNKKSGKASVAAVDHDYDLFISSSNDFECHQIKSMPCQHYNHNI